MVIGNLYSVNGKYIKKPAFFKRNGWYLDVRVWLPLFLALICIITTQYNAKISELRLENDRMIVEMSAIAEQEIVEEVPTPTEKLPDTEPVALARLADSVAFGRSDEVKRIVMWVAINRSEDHSHGYGLSLLEEIARPKQ